MGGSVSTPLPYVPGFSRTTENEDVPSLPEISQDSEVEQDDTEHKSQRKEKLQHELDEFNDLIMNKREQRKQAIAKISDEMNRLRICQQELEKEKELREGLEKQVTALKEVQTVTNEMLQLRESQVTGLKNKLQDMESNTEESLTILRSRYEKQIENIQKLRRLYEERADAVARTHRSEMEREQAKNTLLEIRLREIGNQSSEIEELNKKIQKLEENLTEKDDEIEKEKELRISSSSECKSLTSQLTLINNLFSNLLTGNDLNFDLLTKLLQDNHNLITDLIANGDINETASLLFNIAEKVYKQSEPAVETETETDSQSTLSTRQEIASNLPKVWRVLIELLSRHENCANIVQGGSEECYKSIETPHGSRTVISVSQTFLRLKDLILEKNSLVKEVGRLKTLNGHLENRLDLQERRLGVVCSELRKTWGVVSKLKVQHRQLHTHEKILRYELQHKRQMLTDLKHELKYCRETWDRAREKNTQNEHDWEVLRKEFSLRKARDNSNSAESGYEDDETSQSPEVSTSDSDFDISEGGQRSVDLENGRSPSIEFEDGASDATVIELIDMLDMDAEEDSQEIVSSQSFLDEIQNDIDSSSFLIAGDSEPIATSTQIDHHIILSEENNLTDDTTEFSVHSENSTSISENTNNEYERSNLSKASSFSSTSEIDTDLPADETLMTEPTKTELLDTVPSSDKTVPGTEVSLNTPVMEIEPSLNTTAIEKAPLLKPMVTETETELSSSTKVAETKLSSDRVAGTGTGASSNESSIQRNTEEILSARAERLKRLEMQCRSLLNQMALTSLRSDTLSTRLEELHEQYGSEDRNRRNSEIIEPITSSNADEDKASTSKDNVNNYLEVLLGDMASTSSSNDRKLEIDNSDHSDNSGEDDDCEVKSRKRAERRLQMEQKCMQLFENSSTNTSGVTDVLPVNPEENLQEHKTDDINILEHSVSNIDNDLSIGEHSNNTEHSSLIETPVTNNTNDVRSTNFSTEE